MNDRVILGSINRGTLVTLHRGRAEIASQPLGVRPDRIDPLDSWKARKIAVCRANRRAVFKSNGRKNSIHNQGSGRLTVVQEPAQDIPVLLAWLGNTGDRLREPG